MIKVWSGILMFSLLLVISTKTEAQIVIDPDIPVFCVGSTVDLSYTGDGTAILFWLTIGGDPATTTDSAFTVTYNTPGFKSIILIALEDPFFMFESVVVVEQPTSPTINTMFPAGAPCEGETVSATFNPGTGGVGCIDEYQFSTRVGATWLGPFPYVEGTPLPTGGMDEIIIEGRRSGCDAIAGCNASAWTQLAQWSIINDATPPVITTCATDKFINAGPTCQVAVPDLTSEVLFTDNCDPAPTVTQSPLAGTLIGEGVTIVTLTVTDAGSNTASCNASITVTDITAPVITACAPDLTIALTGSCELLVPDMTGSVTATDNCTVPGLLVVTQVPAAGVLLPSGEGTTHVVVMTVDDGNGNTTDCNVTLTGDDDVVPVITACAPDLTIALTGSCELLVPDMTGSVTATDNCTVPGSLVITQVPAAGVLLPSGEGTTHVIVMTVDDGNGNTTDCNVTLTGDDDVSPVITACAPDLTIALTGSCELLVPDMTGSVTATDNCTVPGSLVITQVPAAGVLLPSGEGTTHVIVMTVDDGNGNTTDCNVTLTGDDDVAPVITACAPPLTIALTGTCELLVPDMTGSVTATDNCTVPGSLVITQVPADGVLLPSGEGTTHVIVMTVDDGNGNKTDCNVTLTGDDDVAPVITACAPDLTIALTGTCELLVPDMTGSVTATDNCTVPGSLVITQVPAAGVLLPSGEGTTHVIVMTVDDGNGNTTDCNVTLTGDDDVSPVITACAPDLTIALTGTCELLVPDMTGSVTATDNCTVPGSLVITQVPAAGVLLPSGEGTTHVVVMTVDDGNGNTIDCNVTLTGDDDVAPVITACAPDLTIALTGSCELLVPDMTGSVTATDNCTVPGSLVITQVPAAGVLLPSGEGTTHVIVMTVDDGNGNTIDCNVTLTGDDDVAPVITACAPDLTIALTGSCELLVPDMTGSVTATDNCTVPGSLVVTQVPAAGVLLPSGEGTTHTIVMTVDDGNGNTTDCNVTLTGDDDVAPVITACAPSLTIALTGSCELLVPDMTGSVTATDNCTAPGSLVFTQVPAAGVLLPSGEGTTHTIVMTVDDGNGNTTDCNVTLTGDDDVAPVITVCAPPLTIALTGSCELLVPDMTGSVTATDNCTAPGSLVFTQVPAAGVLLPSGEGTTHTIVMTVDDGNGNTTDCNVTLTGDDDVAPVITACAPPLTIALTGSCELLVPDMTGSVTATDNCTVPGSLVVTQVPAAGVLLPSGEGTTHVVVMTVDDGNGNTIDCNVTLTGDDDVAPVITACAPPLTIALTGSCELLVPDMTGSVTATDNCTVPGSLVITQVPAAGVLLPSGEGTTHVIVMTVDDGNGNTTDCNVTLIGDDDVSPVITACAPPLTIALTGSCELLVTDMTGSVTATDNCTVPGSLVITQVPAAGVLLPSGEGTTHTIVMTVDDGNGNTIDCNVTLTGDDDVAPVITACAPPLTIALTGSCELLVPDMTGSVTATDNCTVPGSLVVTQVPAAGVLLPSGEGTTHTIVMTVDDGNGNTTDCNVTLTGDDDVAPVITACAPDLTIALTGSCELLVPDMTGSVTATDNCTVPGSLVITQVPAAGVLLPSGEGTTHVIVMTVDDGNGNTIDCNVTLTGDDDVAPVITACAPDLTIALTGTCELLVPDMTGSVTATDNCTVPGSLVVTQVPAAGVLLPSGEGTTHTIVMTVDDGNGNTTDCNVTLTGDDDVSPVITACAPDLTIALTGSCELLVPDMTGSVTATDNCTVPGSLVITQVPAAGVLLLSGEGTTHVIVMTVDDGNGNTTDCNVTLTGDDDVAPVIITCVPDSTVFVDGSGNYILPDFSGLILVLDNCNPSPLITQNPVAGTVISGVGTVRTITMTADDENGNSVQCTFDVTLASIVISCPGDLNEFVVQDCEFVIPDYRNLAIATGDTGITQIPAIGTIISGHGTIQSIALTAFNAAGASASCTFDITLFDTISPVVICQDITIQLDAAGSAAIVAADVDGGSTDNCGIATSTALPDAFTCADIGSNVVTLTVTDINGNTSTCNANVTVEDIIPPTIGCPGDISVTAADGNCSMVVNGIAPLAAGDNCGSPLISYRLEGATSGNGSGDASGNSFNGGVTTVWYAVTDIGGNSDSCSFAVTVVTSILPPDSSSVDRESVCPGDGNITMSYSGGSVGVGINAVWYDEALFTTIIGMGNDLVVEAPALTTTYYVRFESDCDTTTAASVTVSVLPTPVPVFIEKTENACIDGPLYRYIAGGEEGSLFTWNIINGTIEQNSNDTIFVDWGTEAATGTLELTETSLEGCISDPVAISVDITGPSLELGEDIGLCLGETVTFTPEGDFASYLWHDGSTGSGFTTDQGGWIGLEVTGLNGCTAVDSVFVTEIALPVIDLGQDTTVCSEEGIVLDAGTDGVIYQWSTGDVSQQITVFNNGNQEIWVDVENSGGCVSSDTILIRACDLSHLIDLPTGITPNDDGVNDVWNIKNLEEFDYVVIEVYDQWGTLVWRSEAGYPEPWDGKDMNGKLVPFDSYHFVIHFNDGSDERYIGYITVIH